MKHFLPILKSTFVFFLLLLATQKSNSQALLTENFDYPNGTILTSAGWSAHSGAGSQAIDVVVPGLTFAGYPLSNIGGAAQLDNTGEDINKSFTSVASGAVYTAFMVKVDGISDGYFFHLGMSTIATTYFGRVWVSTGTGGNFKFGLTKGSETTPVNTTTEYTTGTTYLVVLKYNIVDGVTNDEVSLYVFNGAIPAAEPATATIPAFTTTAADNAPGSVALRQYNAAQKIIVDGIRVGKTWAEAVTSGAAVADVTPPVFNAGFPKLANIDATKADLQVNLDEPGKVFYLVVAKGSTAPTVAQVIAGVNYGAVTKIAAGSIDVSAAATVKSATITGLTDKTNYDVYVVAQDDEPTPNKQTTPVLVSLFTIRPADQIFKADFNTSLAPFTAVSITGDVVWDLYTITADNKCTKISGYVSSVYQENQDYLISPQIDLSSSELNKMSFISAKSYTGPAMKVLISENFNGKFTPADVKAATWNDISSNFTFSTGNFAFVPSGEFSLSAYTGKVYIAFVYESTTTQAATWEFDDFLITGYKKNTASEKPVSNEIKIYPNPAQNFINIENTADVNTIEIYSITGKKYPSVINNGLISVKLNTANLTPGIYFLKLNKDKNSEVFRFIKN